MIIAAPAIVQAYWPVAVDSAAWLFALFAAIAIQTVFEARRRLRIRAQFDADSGLPNRASLEAALAASPDTIMAAAAIKRFEFIRDSIGIAATNEMIRASADKLEALVGSPIYRIAPDMLAFALPTAMDVNTVLRSVENAFREPVDSRAGPVDVAFTVGLDRNDAGHAPVLCIERAVAAVGKARSSGKSFEWYEDAIPQGRRQLSMMSDLRQAMDSGRLHLAYQPKLSLQTGQIGDAEALIRWQDVDGNFVRPDEFIPLAEATGVIREVTIFALRSALADIAAWHRAGASVRVAVNVSALDLATDDSPVKSPPAARGQCPASQPCPRSHRKRTHQIPRRSHRDAQSIPRARHQIIRR